MSELIDNRAHRVRTLKSIVERLHRGEDAEAVRAQLRELVGETTSGEIAAMEQELMASGTAASEIQAMCDLHHQVLAEFVVNPVPMAPPPGHPVDTFQRENRALRSAVAETRSAWAQALAGDPVDLATLREPVGGLMDVERHYARKENLLFSMLERHDITGPSQVMWGKDDEVREMLRALEESLGAGSVPREEALMLATAVVEPALAAMEEMIAKEERILLPMALETLTDDEWGEIWRDSPRHGYCLVEPQQGWRPPEATPPARTAELPPNDAVVFPTGALSWTQLKAIFTILPLDLTFVDADDRVRFFSEGKERVFERSKAILGRKVHHCHPPKSVHMVEEILAAFRAGREDVAEFWIELGGRFVHIRYFAVRDEDGGYLGTLEMTQDVAPLRALDGERRLLDFGSAA